MLTRIDIERLYPLILAGDTDAAIAVSDARLWAGAE